MNLIKAVKNNLLNIPGWRSNRRIIVFESDDWGSIRMPSIKVAKMLQSKDIQLFWDNGFDLYDTIASREDLQFLFEICHSVKDLKNKPAIITACTVMTNPDFNKIRESKFNEYHFELLTETMERYHPGKTPFPIWLDGIKEGVFFPQFHGREHMNVNLWLDLLRNNTCQSRLVFDAGVFSQIFHLPNDFRNHVLATYNYKFKSEREFLKESIREGLTIFENIFGYRSLSAIAPCYTWDNFIENCFAENGIKFIQSSPFQHLTTYEVLNTHKKGNYHYLGERNHLGQMYLVRNAFFEPSTNKSFDHVDDCLKRINIAFRWGKPAIICTHRLNFVGVLNIKNRDNNLKLFSALLKEIIKKWPNVEFISSADLGDQIIKD
jgi:hypothetical protein